MIAPSTIEELQQWRDEILSAPVPAAPADELTDAPIVPRAASWLPQEIPCGTAKALVLDIAIFLEKFTAFLGEHPCPQTQAFLERAPSPRGLLRRSVDPAAIGDYARDYVVIQEFNREMGLLVRYAKPAPHQRLGARVKKHAR